MKIFRLKDLIDNKDNPKIVKKILDSTELSKLDKKDILNDLKGISKGDSVDDGMMYFKLENSSISGIESDYCVSCIVENEDGDRVLVNTPPGRDRIAIQTSNKIIYDTYRNKTMLENLIDQALQSDLDFLNEPTIKQITAKEYYSLINK